MLRGKNPITQASSKAVTTLYSFSPLAARGGDSLVKEKTTGVLLICFFAVSKRNTSLFKSSEIIITRREKFVNSQNKPKSPCRLSIHIKFTFYTNPDETPLFSHKVPKTPGTSPPFALTGFIGRYKI